MAERPLFPFTALVGQDLMCTALLLHAIHPGLGGVLVRGQKGTAKSTAVRALARLMPVLNVVSGCPFGCDPADSASACEDCAERLAAGSGVPVERRALSVVELPIGATEDRVLGSLDLETAIQSGTRRFEPGLLARANRGILYVDEVNLLGDHLVDVLLDAAAMGRNYVEREAVSFSHPASFMLIGTMNPEEGELRPQLLDRFALMVEVETLKDPAQRADAVRRRIAFDKNPEQFVAAWAEREAETRRTIVQARSALPDVRVSDDMVALIVTICAAFEVDGLRADLAIYRAATALAAYQGQSEVDREHIRAAAELALGHRRRRQPFDDPGLDRDQLDRIVDGESGGRAADADGAQGKREPPRDSRSQARPPAQRNGRPTEEQPRQNQAHTSLPPSPARLLPSTKAPRQRATPSGRRDAAGSERSGAPSGLTLPAGREFELALSATLRAAAPYQAARREANDGTAIRLRPTDLRARIRRGRSSAMTVFVVDASGSMGARNRIAIAKSSVMNLLLDAYRRRDRVALIAFRGERAELLLPPTNSVALAESCLRVLPTGGRTPLAAGIKQANDLFLASRRNEPARLPVLVIVSDGKANAAAGRMDPWSAALAEAGRSRSLGVTSVFLDTEPGWAGAGLGRVLAQTLGGEHLALNTIVRGHQGADA